MIKKHYVANMPQQDVAALDKRRGEGDLQPFNMPTRVKRKEPWKVQTPDHIPEGQETIEPQGVKEKVQPQVQQAGSVADVDEDSMKAIKSATKLLKAYGKGLDRIPEGGEKLSKPEPERKEGESGKEYASRLVGHHMEHKDEHSGGKKQAIAIGLSEARESGVKIPVKKADWGMSESGRAATHLGQLPKPAASPKPKFGMSALGEAKQKLVAQGVKPVSRLGLGKAHDESKETPHDEAMEGPHSETLEHMKECAACKEKSVKKASSFSGPRTVSSTVGMSSGGGSMKMPAAPKPSIPGLSTQGASALSAMKSDKEDDDKEVEKALNSRSFPVIRRPITSGADIFRSGIDPITRNNSKIYGREGVSPLVGETLEQVSDRDLNQTPKDAISLKSCTVHGTTFKSAAGCGICYVAKSNLCKNCGSSMMKSPGGQMVCSSCKGY